MFQHVEMCSDKGIRLHGQMSGDVYRPTRHSHFIITTLREINHTLHVRLTERCKMVLSSYWHDNNNWQVLLGYVL